MDNVIFEDHFTQYAISASREYQEIHPYSAMNIDSVNINTSLIMMKECQIQINDLILISDAASKILR